MNWPWVSSARLDDALGQVAFLRAENTKLTDSLTRISRREVGLPEVPRAARPPTEPIPRDILEHCNSYASSSVCKLQRDTALRCHAQGESWESIRARLKTEEEEVP